MAKSNASSEKDMEKLIAKYNQDLMRFYQKNKARILPETEEKTSVAKVSPAVSVAEVKTPPIEEIAEVNTVPVSVTKQDVPAPVSVMDSSPQSMPAVPAPETPMSIQEDEELDLPSGMRSAPEVLEEDTEEVPTDMAPEEPEVSLGENTPEHLEGTDNGTGEPATETGREPDGDEEEDESDTGYLQIRAFTARSALPIQNAFVTVSKKKKDSEDLIWLALTNSDGVTETLALPTVSRNASQEPGGPIAFSVYNVQVDAAGFYSIRNIGVPIYGGISAVQPVELIPLPEQTSSGNLVFPEAGPQELE